jgi:iron complex transport system permease protein
VTTRGESIMHTHLALGRAAGVRGRPLLLAGGGLAALAVALVLGVGFGSVSIEPADTVAILAQRLLGIDLGREYSAAAETIVMDLRLPRVLTAMLVGLALAVAGVTFPGSAAQPAG